MRNSIVLLIIIINFILQSTLLQFFRIFGILPNTSLIIVVVFAILWGKNRGAVIGFSTGLLQDIFLGRVFGANALIYMLIGYNVGGFENKIFKDNHLTPILFTVLSTITYHLLYYGMSYLTQSKISFIDLFKNIVVMEMVYNSLISLMIYKTIYSLIRYPNMKIR